MLLSGNLQHVEAVTLSWGFANCGDGLLNQKHSALTETVQNRAVQRLDKSSRAGMSIVESVFGRVATSMCTTSPILSVSVQVSK